jgi:hypothetical protein
MFLLENSDYFLFALILYGLIFEFKFTFSLLAKVALIFYLLFVQLFCPAFVFLQFI